MSHFKPMRVRLSAGLTVAALTLTSCYTAGSEVVRGSLFEPMEPLPASTSIEVVMPDDGIYGGRAYLGSGRAVASRIQQAARDRFPDTSVIQAPSAGAAAPSERRTLRVEAVIHQWEDRATNWSGVADKIRVQLTLRDGPRVRRDLTYSAHSTWWTFVNSPPEELLDSYFDEAVLDLLPEVGDGVQP